MCLDWQERGGEGLRGMGERTMGGVGGGGGEAFLFNFFFSPLLRGSCSPCVFLSRDWFLSTIFL